jgi:hypothetical protein
MRNEEVIIKAAKIIVDDNNKVYKLSAKEVAYIIYATDGNGTQDRFITKKTLTAPQEWKNAFQRAGFTNVNVKPFGTMTIDGGVGGDLDIGEVTADLFNNSTNRPKINYSESPSRDNPYGGTQNIPADSRLGMPSIDTTNELQEFMLSKLKSSEDRIRAGWYGGTLVDWIDKLKSDTEGSSIKEILDMEFPYMNNSTLEKHLLDRQLKLEDYNPSKYEIKYFAITMRTLEFYLTQTGFKFLDVPENRVKDQLEKIIQSAMTFKKHKHYGQKEMSEYHKTHKERIAKDQDDTKDAIYYLLRSMFA